MSPPLKPPTPNLHSSRQSIKNNTITIYMPTSNTDATSSPPRLNETVGFGKAVPHLLRRSGVAPRHLSRHRWSEPSQNLSQHLHTVTRKKRYRSNIARRSETHGGKASFGTHGTGSKLPPRCAQHPRRRRRPVRWMEEFDAAWRWRRRRNGMERREGGGGDALPGWENGRKGGRRNGRGIGSLALAATTMEEAKESVDLSPA